MDWTHALVALVSATLGAAAHKIYAWYARKAYWAHLGLMLRRVDRRRHTMRMKPRRGYTMVYGHMRDRSDPFF